MKFRENKGLTLLEVLVAVLISTSVIAAVYRTFLDQQRNHTVQEEVGDMQQNMRIAVQRMMAEIRMAGFGNIPMVLPVTLGGRTFNNILNPDVPVNDSLTILSARDTSASLSLQAEIGDTEITVSNAAFFNTADNKYISIGGVESCEITNITGSTLTLGQKLIFNHNVGTRLFGIRAISYRIGALNGKPVLLREESAQIGNDQQDVVQNNIQADNIESLQFQYFDADDPPNEIADPEDFRMIRVTVTARTENPSLGPNGGGSYRRREVASNIHLQNMGLEP